MSVNIQAIEALFGSKPAKQSKGVIGDFGSIQGACPFDAILAAMGPGAFAPEFVKVIDEVRADARWGAVYRGDLSAHGGNHSRADLALCGEFVRRGLRAEAVDIAFRTSRLYRKKWERLDYRTRTIGLPMANASANASTNVSPSPVDLFEPQNGRIKISTGIPAPRDYILEGLLSPGKAAVLGGFGGVSKTQFALQLAASVVLNADFMDKETKPGKVMAILGEEDQAEVNRRISAMARYRNYTAAEISTIEANLLAYPVVGQSILFTSKEKFRVSETAIAQRIIDASKNLKALRLIVLDHLGLIHGGDFNAREDAALTMRIVNRIANETGAAVLVLAHTPKSAGQAENSDASMIAGSTAFVDQARAAWVLATMRQKEAEGLRISNQDRKAYVSLTIVKNNYGPTGDIFWFKRVPFDGVGLLEFVDLSLRPAATTGAANLDTKIVAFVTTHRGEFSKTKIRETQSGKKANTFKVSKGALEAAIDKLLAEGRLINRAPTDDERKSFGHGPRVKQVLDVGGP